MPGDVCPTETALKVIAGKWKPMILYHLYQKTYRFNELRRLMPSITHKVLAQQLHELEKDMLIQREVFEEMPLRVEYSLTDYGLTLTPIMQALSQWGLQHRAATQQLNVG